MKMEMNELRHRIRSYGGYLEVIRLWSNYYSTFCWKWRNAAYRCNSGKL